MSDKAQLNSIQIVGMMSYDTRRPKPVFELNKEQMDNMRSELKEVLNKYARRVENHEIGVIFNFDHK